MSEDTSTTLGEVDPAWAPEPIDHVYEATNAVHALWIAHRKLCRLYEQRYESATVDPSTGTLRVRPPWDSKPPKPENFSERLQMGRVQTMSDSVRHLLERACQAAGVQLGEAGAAT